MKERPILFNCEMVRAILDGRKTQTRRALKYQPFEMKPYKIGKHNEQLFDCRGVIIADSLDQYLNKLYLCPFGKVGDRLWVRETFASREQYPPPGNYAEKVRVEYRAGGDQWFDMRIVGSTKLDYDGKFFPSIHMPRWASRITLEITNVRVERLQNISESDCCAEGCGSPITRDLKKPKFRRLWDSVYNNWDQDPWVWVIEFKRLT